MPAPDVPKVRAFFADLAARNEKPWWEENKARYEKDLKAPALELLEGVAVRLTAAGHRGVTTKLFRPHRDVRFSKDKTPYHTHLHMLWSLGEGPNAPGLFYGISPDYVTLGCGVMGFDKEGLTRWRAALDRDAGDISDLVAGLERQGARLRDPDLKRIPAPFDADHPNGELLKHKGLALWRDLTGSPDESAVWTEARGLLPLADWITAHI